MDKNVMAQLLVPVIGQQSFDAVTYVHDLVLERVQAAYADGSRSGYNRGNVEGLALGTSQGYDLGYQEGVRDTLNIAGAQSAGAYNAGYDEGYDDGRAEPHPDAWSRPASEVYQAGYDAGHLAGWDAAVEDDVTYNDLVNRSH